ncbi:MAG TPA: DUF4397 domain-containing protein [Candidatus Kapabacteria bacterium]|nr:DUF4397 domain-containing protein [Candidatus Kapabacteria bacterium]
MNRFSMLLRSLFVLMAVSAAIGFNACSSDSPSSPPGPVGSSTITVMHANPGFSSDVIFKQDTTTLGRLSYGTLKDAMVNNGTRTIDVRATDGASLTSTSITVDSTVSIWVIYTGSSTEKESFRISNKKLAVTADNAAIRVVHASKTINGNINVKINSATGLPLTQTPIPYQQSSDYVTVPIASTSKLIILRSDNTTQLLEVPVTFVSGKSYTIVVYGSTDVNADPSVKLTYKIEED